MTIMVKSRTLTPTLIILSALMLAGCGMANGEGGGFESAARRVADISLSSNSEAGARSARHETGTQAPEARVDGLRSAMPLRVEVLDPHDLWDARDGLAPVVKAADSGDIKMEAVAPVAIKTVSTMMADAKRRPEPAPARPVVEAVVRTRSIQLGAYSSEAAANRAWNMIRSGEASEAMTGLSPILEPVNVNGRALTRLKVLAPDHSAQAICVAADISDRWCARPS